MNKNELIELINYNIASQSYTTAENVRIVLYAMLEYIDQKAEEDNQVINNIKINLEDNNLLLNDYGTRITALEQSSYLFQFSSDKPIKDTKGRVNYWYSFRGVLNGYVNYTFRIEPINNTAIKGAYGEPFEFDFSGNPNLISALNGILSNQNSINPSFLVNFINLLKTPSLKRTAAMTLEVKNNMLVHKIYPMDYMEGDTDIFEAGDKIYYSTTEHTTIIR